MKLGKTPCQTSSQTMFSCLLILSHINTTPVDSETSNNIEQTNERETTNERDQNTNKLSRLTTESVDPHCGKTTGSKHTQQPTSMKPTASLIVAKTIIENLINSHTSLEDPIPKSFENLTNTPATSPTKSVQHLTTNIKEKLTRFSPTETSTITASSERSSIT